MLVHDSYSSVDDAAAADIFTKIQNAFDSTFCHFLQVKNIVASWTRKFEKVYQEIIIKPNSLFR